MNMISKKFVACVDGEYMTEQQYGNRMLKQSRREGNVPKRILNHVSGGIKPMGEISDGLLEISWPDDSKITDIAVLLSKHIGREITPSVAGERLRKTLEPKGLVTYKIKKQRRLYSKA